MRNSAGRTWEGMAEDGYKRGLEAVQNGQADEALNKLRAAAEHPERLSSLSKLLIAVDDSRPMNSIRNYWDKRPHLAQWSLLNLQNTPLALVTGYDFWELLIKCGFIDYKGHLHEDPAIMEQKVQAMGGKADFLLTHGIKIGKYLCPEVKLVEPFIGPLRKLHSIFADTMDKVRGQVRAARLERERQNPTVEVVTSSINTQIANLVDPTTPAAARQGLPHLPHMPPANDNAGARTTSHRKAA